MARGIKALIVIYNKSLKESLTLNSIAGEKGVEIYIADNSTKDYKNAEYALRQGYHYFDMGGNTGLSKAYNRVISQLEKNEDLICLFDDDTRVGSGYFETLRKAAKQQGNIDIFAPIVRDRKGILSPCVFKVLKGIRVRDVEKIPKNNISVINSGLAIRLRVFNDYKYDEGLFLDYIDHAFIKDVINRDKSKIHIMDAIIEQNFSGSSRLNAKENKERFLIFKKDMGYFCGKYGVPIFFCKLSLLMRRVSAFLKHIFVY